MTILRRLTSVSSSLTPRALSIVLMLPFAYGILRQLIKPNHWFKDFDAVMCAGQAVLAGQSPYAGGFNCVSAQPQAFVYTPIAAKAFAGFQAMFGLSFEIAFIGGLICFVMFTIFRRLFENDQYLVSRAPLMAGLSASALTSGNLSIGIHGLIFLGSRVLYRYPAALVALVVMAAIIKPTFVVYLALFLFAGGTMRQRLIQAVIAASLIMVYFGHFYVMDAANFATWVQSMHMVGMVAERGMGFMGLPLINAIDDTSVVAACYVVFAALILGSGVVIAETYVPDQRQRFALGISVCVLLYPRLMAYDEYTLPFGVAVALGCCQRIGQWRMQQITPLLAPICLIFAVTGGQLGGRLLFDLVCVLLISMAATVMAQRLRSGSLFVVRTGAVPVASVVSREH